MRKIVLDFVFDERTGESRIVVGYEDPELTTLELNEAIRGGQVRDEVIALAGSVFGADVGGRLRDGKIPVVCTDHHPEFLDPGDAPAISQADAATKREDQKQ